MRDRICKDMGGCWNVSTDPVFPVGGCWNVRTDPVLRALALIRGSADLMVGDWISARNNLMDGLATLLMFKGGEALGRAKLAELKNQLQLKVKQAVFKAQELMQGLVTKSPLEFSKKGPEGKEVILTEKSVPSNDPAVPPVTVTEVKTAEQAAKECENSLQENADGSVEFVDPFTDPVCFVAGTLVHTKDGLKPIEQIKVGDYVLSRPDSGEDEQAYKKVTKTFASENKEVWVVDYVYNNEPRARSLVVTANHPLWVKGKGWTAVKDLGYPDCFEIHNPGEIIEQCYFIRALPIYETNILDVGWAYDFNGDESKGPTIDLRNNQLKVSSCYEEDTYGEISGPTFKQRVYNLEVEDFHTYYVGEPGVWVHNTCPNIAGTVENVKVALNNPAEAAAGLSPSPKAYVYSEYGSNLVSRNLESMGLQKQGVVIGLKPSSANAEANALAATQPGAMTPDNAYLAARGYPSPYGYAAEWGVLFPNSKTGGRDVMFFESRLTAKTAEGLLAYTRTFNDVKMSLGPIYKLDSSGTIADFATRFARTEMLNQIRRGYDAQKATGANFVYTLPDVLPASEMGWVLHDMTPLQQAMKLMQDEVLNKGYQWADAWMFRDIAKPDVFYSFNEANLLPGAIQVQITFPDGTLGPTLWKGEAKLSTEPIANDYTTGSLAGNTSINVGLTTAYLYTASQGVGQSIAQLVQAHIDALLPAAKQYWLNAGALPSVLNGIQFSVGQLPAAVAAQTQNNQITLSADGAGWGWFVDPTPMDSLEFINSNSTQWIAPADSAASGKLDLLTVMIHEMGHALGLQHDASGAMEAVLQPGERNMPSGMEASLLQKIREAVTAQINTAAVSAAPAMQYQAVANPGYVALDAGQGWSTQGGVSVAGGAATLQEVASSQSRLNQVFVVNPNDRYLTFTLSGAALADPLPNPLPQAGEGANVAASGSGFGPHDAFEVALLDANRGGSLLGGDGLTRTDAFLNLQADGTQHAADCVSCVVNADGSRTYCVDLSGIAAGTVVNLSFDLIGFGQDNSHVTVSNVRVSGLPDLHDDAASVAEDTPLAYNPFAQVENAALLQLGSHVVDQPAHGSVSVNADGTFVYTPEANYFGSDRRTSDTLLTQSAVCGRRCYAATPAPEGSTPPRRGRTYTPDANCFVADSFTNKPKDVAFV